MLEGQPELVYAQQRHTTGNEGEDRAFLLIEEGRGRTATIQGGWINGYPSIAASDDICFQVVGSRGYLVGRRPDQLTEVGWNGVIVHPITPVDAFKEELRAYFTARDRGDVAPVPGDAGISAQAVIEAARRSASELRGRGVRVETG
jgi:predicted dehydrogenase